MITEPDDYFTHQLVQPHVEVEYNDPTWAERAFFTVGQHENFLLEFGMSYFPNAGTLEAYSVATVRGTDTQHNLRASRPLGDSRWEKTVGPFEFETVSPLKTWALQVKENESPIQFDLRYEARGEPLQCRSPRIRKEGRLVYDNVDFFQPGRYHGEVRVGDRTFELDGTPGHRDRTWGIRTSGEGKIKRGILIWFEAEYEDYSAMSLIHERHNGDKVMAAGAITYEDGEQIPFKEFNHNLTLKGDTKLFESGEFSFTDENGKTWEFSAEQLFPLFMSGAGYRSSEGRRGDIEEASMITETWDQTDIDSIPEGHSGLIDNMSWIEGPDGETHGVVELLVGQHERYWPASDDDG